MFDFKIIIANRIFRFKCNDKRLAYNASKEKDFNGFLYPDPRNADFTFEIKYGKVPNFGKKKILFAAKENWILSKYKDDFLIEYPDKRSKGRMEKTIKINENMVAGVIYINRRQRNASKILGQKIIAEIKVNLFQVFLVEYLIKKRTGFLAHSATVRNGKEAYLFMGQRDAGKSTISRLWHEKAGATIFNDDRAIITVKNKIPYFYNAPWAGAMSKKCMFGLKNEIRIHNIFFIYHRKDNRIDRLSKIEAARKIFKHSFPVFWNRRDLGFILNICSKIASSVPCYDLGFVNNDSVVEFIKRRMEKNEKATKNL